MVTLYHYTLLRNVQSILQSGLWASIRIEGKPETDAVQGNGQYFTDTKPVEAQAFPREDIAQAFFDIRLRWGVTGSPEQIAWIEVVLEDTRAEHVADLYDGALKATLPNRGIWLHRATTSLPPRFIANWGILKV